MPLSPPKPAALTTGCWSPPTAILQPVVSAAGLGGDKQPVVSGAGLGGDNGLLVAANGNPAAQTQAGIPVGLPFTLSINATAANNLTQGTYTEQANILDSNSVQQE